VSSTKTQGFQDLRYRFSTDSIRPNRFFVKNSLIDEVLALHPHLRGQRQPRGLSGRQARLHRQRAHLLEHGSRPVGRYPGPQSPAGQTAQGRYPGASLRPGRRYRAHPGSLSPLRRDPDRGCSRSAGRDLPGSFARRFWSGGHFLLQRQLVWDTDEHRLRTQIKRKNWTQINADFVRRSEQKSVFFCEKLCPKNVTTA